MNNASDTSGVFIVRAWREEGSGSGLRARITRTLDVTRREEATWVVDNPEDACLGLRQWMEALRENPSP
jgi:hypothetical protein